MADEVLVGLLKIAGMVDTTAVREGLSRMNGLVQGFTKKLSGIGSGLSGVTALAGGLGVAATAASALNTALDIEDMTVGLGKAANLSGDQLKDFRDELINLGTELRGIRTDEIIEIATAGAKLGVPTDQLAAYTKNIAMLKTAFDDMSADDISNGIGILTNQFSLEAADGALKLGSAIDALADSAATNGADLINTMQRMGGSAKLLGLGADQTAALATALLDTGSSAEKAGGSLNRLFIAIADQSRATDFAALLGVSEGDFQRMLHDEPLAALEGFLAALKGKDLTQVGSLLGSVGITSGEDVAEIAKLSLQTDKLSGLLAIANQEFLTGARAQQSYAESANTTRAKFDQLMNTLTKMAVIVGDVMLPILNAGLDNLIPQIQGFADSINKTNGSSSMLADSISLFGLAGKTVVAVLATLSNVFWGFVSTFSPWGDDTATQAAENARKAQESAEEAFKNLFDPKTIQENMNAATPTTGADITAPIQDKVAEAIKNIDVASLSTDIAETTESTSKSPDMLATNLQMGSVEAYRAEARFRSGFSRNDTQEKTAQNTAQTVVELQSLNKNIKNLSSGGLTALPI